MAQTHSSLKRENKCTLRLEIHGLTARHRARDTPLRESRTPGRKKSGAWRGSSVQGEAARRRLHAAGCGADVQ